jgi:SAM-dependent methyltransferase
MTAVQVQYRPCAICGGTACHMLHEMRFALPQGSPLPAGYAVIACARCGFVYADTPGSAADYARHYEEFSHYEDPAIATGSGEQAFDRQRLAETADWLAQHVETGTRVLDIGCGNGGLLQALRERGFNSLAGMDPSANCVARLGTMGFRAWRGWLGDLPPAQEKFDLIILSHVLEHLLDPRPALASLHALLTESGRVYVETPDAARYADFPSVPFYYFDSEHINHFDRAALENLARTSGFHVLGAAGKQLKVQGGHPYPAVFALLSATGTQEPIVPDDTVRRAVSVYVERSILASRLPEPLRAALQRGRPIALWGAGSQAQRLLQQDAMRGAHIIAVVDGDRNKQGSRFAGCIVAAPAQGLQGLPHDTLVVIAAALVAEQILAGYHALGLPYECIIN